MVLFAVLDCSSVIREAHLQAALAVWEYCGESARYAFGERLGDPLLDKLAAGLKASGMQGLSKTQIHGDIFQRNQSGERIAAALVRLEEMGLARKIPREGESRGGRMGRVVPVFDERILRTGRGGCRRDGREFVKFVPLRQNKASPGSGAVPCSLVRADV